MYSFEGEFRRKPAQSLGGITTKERKDVLISRTQDERRKREEIRLRQSSSLKIQAFYRGAKTRECQKQRIRDEFDRITQKFQKTNKPCSDVATLCELCQRLQFFYTPTEDGTRLIWLGQQLIRENAAVAKRVWDVGSPGLYQIKNILLLCCRHLMCPEQRSTPIAVPLRLLEIFTDVSVFAKTIVESQSIQIVHHILQFLIAKGYYKCMQSLLVERIPDSIEYTVLPPTPLAGSILDLIKRPVVFAVSHADPPFRNDVLCSMSTELLSPAFCEQIKQFVLPALAIGWKDFPFTNLLHALTTPCVACAANQLDDSVHEKDRSEGGLSSWSVSVPSSPWLLRALLLLAQQRLASLCQSDLERYLFLLHHLTPTLHPEVGSQRHHIEESDSDDDDEEEMEVDLQGCSDSLPNVRRECLQLMDEPSHVRGVVQAIGKSPDTNVLTAACTVCHSLMARNKLMIHKTRLLYSLAFNPGFIRNVWRACSSTTVKRVTGTQTPLLQVLSRGMHMTREDIQRIAPLLSVFCSLFSHSLLSLHDAEFYGENTESKSFMPFKVHELVPMSLALRDACVGIIELAHPDSRPTLKEDYKKAFQSVGIAQDTLTVGDLRHQRETWAHLFRVIMQLVRQLYARNSRRPFCPENHWLSPQVSIKADKLRHLYRSPNQVFVRRKFGALSALNPNRTIEDEGPPLSTNEVRQLTILTEVPFVVSFHERVKIFHHLVHQDKVDHQGEMGYLVGDHVITLMVRRNYLYEDAFEKLSTENEPNLKKRMQIQLVNFAGLDEAGIDGGGIFREFMGELLKTSFNPNRGLFKYTNDKLLYPNPQSRLLLPDFQKHYYHLGRMLGKAMYENMLVELPFASFFLSKILSHYRGDVDIHHLASLDPEMYRNLLFLKNYDGDVSELGLDFTVVNNELGEAQVEELKPGGREIPVTIDNRIQYIHLMADYRLNKQIRDHCNAFRAGLADVINIDWLRMFDHNELQVLISGAHVPIDVNDLRRFTNYSGGYTEEHQVIQSFWRVVEGFTDEQKCKLLKFVTSCSRPPLLGFQELYPAFCIHNGGSEERLPTASTCMNLLKLPEFKDEETLKQKLTYAVESGAGFELS